MLCTSNRQLLQFLARYGRSLQAFFTGLFTYMVIYTHSDHPRYYYEGSWWVHIMYSPTKIRKVCEDMWFWRLKLDYNQLMRYYLFLRSLMWYFQMSRGKSHNLVDEENRGMSYQMMQSIWCRHTQKKQRLLWAIRYSVGGHTTKTFVECQKINRRYARLFSVDPSDVMHIKIHASVIVLGMTSKGRVSQLRLFERGLRLNSFSYTGVMDKVVNPWINFGWDGTPYVLPGNLHQPAKLGWNEIRWFPICTTTS